MSRDDGFAVADLSTDLLDDPKVKTLWRALAPDQDRMSRALLLHVATLLASWRQGARVTVTEAVPVWLAPDESLVKALTDARMLDRTGRIPPKSWRGWFGPAWERREKRRKAGALGGRPSTKPPGNHMDSTRLTLDNPDRPSGRSVRTVRQDRNGARRNDAKVGTLAETMAAMGLEVKP